MISHHRPHLIAALTFAALGAAACMDSPPDFGMYPAEDDPDVSAHVTKEEAAAVAEVALQGLNERRYDLWTTRWDQSMLDAIPEDAWEDFRDAFVERYGRSGEILETRLTRASQAGYVRFSFLVAFERGEVMLIHSYPQDGDEITGVHVRDAVSGEAP